MSESSPRHGQAVDTTLQDFKWAATGQQPCDEAPRLPQRQKAEAGGQRVDSSSGSTSQTTSESSARPGLNRTASGGRQRSGVLATTGKARTRPLLGRRKSSSQKSAGASTQPKSPRAQGEASITESPTGMARKERLAAIGPPPGLPVPSRFQV
jgi:hypothetical protein